MLTVLDWSSVPNELFDSVPGPDFDQDQNNQVKRNTEPNVLRVIRFAKQSIAQFSSDTLEGLFQEDDIEIVVRVNVLDKRQIPQKCTRAQDDHRQKNKPKQHVDQREPSVGSGEFVEKRSRSIRVQQHPHAQLNEQPHSLLSGLQKLETLGRDERAHQEQVEQKVAVVEDKVAQPVRCWGDSSGVEHAPDVFFLFVHGQNDKRPSHDNVPLESEHVVWVFASVLRPLFHERRDVLVLILRRGLFVDDFNNKLVEEDEKKKDDNVDIVTHEKPDRRAFVEVDAADEHSVHLAAKSFELLGDRLVLVLFKGFPLLHWPLDYTSQVDTVATRVRGDSVFWVFEDGDERLLQGVLLDFNLHLLHLIQPFQHFQQLCLLTLCLLLFQQLQLLLLPLELQKQPAPIFLLFQYLHSAQQLLKITQDCRQLHWQISHLPKL